MRVVVWVALRRAIQRRVIRPNLPDRQSRQRRGIRQAEVGAAKTMLDRTAEQFDIQPSRLVAVAGYGSAEMLGWLVDERGIEPHVKVFDHSERQDGTFSHCDFAYDPEVNVYVCPDSKELKQYHRKPRDGLTKAGTLLYFARKHDCDA